jgi:hypothetical protein
MLGTAAKRLHKLDCVAGHDGHHKASVSVSPVLIRTA